MKKTTRISLLIVFTLAFLLTALPALAASYGSLPGQEVRVLLSGYSNASSHSITIGSGTYSVASTANTGKTLATAASGTVVTFGKTGDGGYTCSVGGDSFSGSSAFIAIPAKDSDYFTFNGTDYRGCFKAMSYGQYFYPINQVNVELYTYGVVGRELGYGLSDAATMAQAVASRSYVLANYSSSHVYYDVTDTTASQVYGGKSAESAKIIQAVDNTRGYVLKYNGSIIQTYYSSNMGGYSENIENVWVSDAVPIKGVPSPYDAKAGDYSSYGASTYSWTVEFTPNQLVAMANRYGGTDIGEFVSITSSDTLNGKTSVSGRAMQVTITGTKGSVTATKDNIRWLLDLKSMLIEISGGSGGSSSAGAYVKGKDGKDVAFSDLRNLYATSGNGAALANGSNSSLYAIGAKGNLTELSKTASNSSGGNIVIKGRGYGHGVGLSQFGTMGMGDAGYTWDQIIKHYFCTDTGIQLVKAY